MLMLDEKHIENFSPALLKILKQELLIGNEVVETASGWPFEKTIIVFLKHPFSNSYMAKDVEFREINDIHYWKSEYVDHKTNHILACKFQ